MKNPVKHYYEQKDLYSPCSCGSGKKRKFCCGLVKTKSSDSKESSILSIDTPSDEVSIYNKG